MASNWPPQKDADLLQVSGDFATKVTAAPADYFYSVAQASANAVVTTAYAEAYAAALNPATRTKVKITAKRAARNALVDNLRIMNRVAQSNPLFTAEKKVELGLPVYAARTPINPVTFAPILSVTSVANRRADITVREPSSSRRGLPVGVRCSVVMSYVAQGTTPPPADPKLWQLEGLPTRGQFTVVFSPTLPIGSQVYLAAAYLSPRNAAGPLCAPVSVLVTGALGDVDPEQSLKIAA